MSSPAQQLANELNAQASTGPRTEEGKSTSSKNAVKLGLFAAHDFIRPSEEELYEELNTSLRHDLAPAGLLEHNLVDEIRRAMWRLRRCGLVEESMASSDSTPDPMQLDTTAKIQLSVDRARSQAHRLLHKCTAELRKLQTERIYRNESTVAGTDLSRMGLSDSRKIEKNLAQRTTEIDRFGKRRDMAQLDAIMDAPMPSGSFCNAA